MRKILCNMIQAYRLRMAHLDAEIAKLDEIERSWQRTGFWRR